MWQYDCFADDFRSLCKENEEDIMMVHQQDTGKQFYSYGEVLTLVMRFLSFCRNHGLKEGDTIVSIMPNSPEAVICFFAALVGGMNYAPLPPAVSRREYDNWIRLVHPAMVIKKEGIVGDDSSVRVFQCKCDGNLSWLPSEEVHLVNCQTSHIYLMTSGTTGTPKAMSINADKLWSSGKAFVRFYQIEETSYRFWNYLPMSYLGGLYNLSLIPLCCRGSFVISEPFSGKTLLNYWKFVMDNEITALWLVPSIVQGLLKIAKLTGAQNIPHCAQAVKIAFLGTAPVQLEVKEEFEQIFGIHLYENFALSESTFLTGEDHSSVGYREQGSVGKALPYVSLKTVPMEEGNRIGVIWVKTPFLFDGYLMEDGSMSISLDEDGYFNTQDLGCITRKGTLVLAGRNRDIIKRGGQFISLNEIEVVVGKMPLIEEVAAVPVKHDFYGEVYVLCVIFRQKEEIERQKEQLRAWISDNFVDYKVPDKICVYSFFPRTDSGKIQKGKLAQEIEGK